MGSSAAEGAIRTQSLDLWAWATPPTLPRVESLDSTEDYNRAEYALCTQATIRTGDHGEFINAWATF